MVERLFFLSIYKNCMIFERPRKMILQFSKKTNNIFFTSCKIIFYVHVYHVCPCKPCLLCRNLLLLNFEDGEYSLFFHSNSWWKDKVYLVCLSFQWCRVIWFQSLFKEFALFYTIRIKLLGQNYHCSLGICYLHSFVDREIDRHILPIWHPQEARMNIRKKTVTILISFQ